MATPVTRHATTITARTTRSPGEVKTIPRDGTARRRERGPGRRSRSAKIAPIETRRSRRRAASWAGLAFLVLFVAGFALSLGELAGRSPIETACSSTHFADGGNRVRDIAGAYLLALAGLAFAWFAHALSRDAEDYRGPLLVTGSMAAAGMVLAATAWATVPMSIWFGSLVDDPASRSAKPYCRNSAG